MLQLDERVGELLHALLLQRVGHVVVVDAGIAQLVEQALRFVKTALQRLLDPAVILKRLDRLLRHRVHRQRPDQLLDVHHVAVRRVLRRRGRPEAALRVRTRACEAVPAVTREHALVVLVRELRVGDRELSREISSPDLFEPLVGLRVDAGDEERRDRAHGREIAAVRRETLQPLDVRLHDLLVPLQREDQRYVDVATGRDRVLDRADACRGRGDLHIQVRLVDPLVQPLGLVVGALAVVRDLGIDLPGDVAVLAVRRVEDRAQQLEAALDVLG